MKQEPDVGKHKSVHLLLQNTTVYKYKTQKQIIDIKISY